MQAAAHLEYGGLPLNPGSGTSPGTARRSSWGAKEYLLLKYLMENKGCASSQKKQLYNAVWDDDYYYDDNTVMVQYQRIGTRSRPIRKSRVHKGRSGASCYKLHKRVPPYEQKLSNQFASIP
jgi:DNA-binding response OmpR family regulator